MSTPISKEGRTIYPIVLKTDHMIKSMNFYLYNDGKSLTLVDAGVNSEESWQEFMHVLNDNNYSIHDIDKVLLTHHHPDHTGIVNRLLKENKVPVYAHSSAIPRIMLDEEYLTMRLDFFEKVYAEMGCGAIGRDYIKKMRNAGKATPYEDGKINTEIIPINDQDKVGTLIAIETPGHAPDHLVFYDKKSKVLFGGDFLLSHISSNAIIEPGIDGNRLQTLVQYVNSFKKISKYDVDIVFPGHHKPIYNPYELIEKRLNGIEKKAEGILDAVKIGHETANELALFFYKDKYKSEFALVLSEIIGHLDYLENKGKAFKEFNEGVWHYYPSLD